EAWKADKVELAILGELLLRGPQTEGELRGRASRMEPIDDLDTLRTLVKRLADRNLIVYLTPEGRRGTVVTHGFHAPEEIQRLRPRPGAAAMHAEAQGPIAAPQPSAGPSSSVARGPDDKTAILETQLTETRSELASLRSLVGDLQSRFETMLADFKKLQESLG